MIVKQEMVKLHNSRHFKLDSPIVTGFILVCIIQLLISAFICYFMPQAPFALFLSFSLLLSELFYHFLLSMTALVVGLFIVTFVPIFVLRYYYSIYWKICGCLLIISRLIYQFITIPKAKPGYGTQFFNFGHLTSNDLPYICVIEVIFGIIVIMVECLFCHISRRYWAYSDTKSRIDINKNNNTE